MTNCKMVSVQLYFYWSEVVTALGTGFYQHDLFSIDACGNFIKFCLWYQALSSRYRFLTLVFGWLKIWVWLVIPWHGHGAWGRRALVLPNDCVYLLA